jgi:hypothetical protein
LAKKREKMREEHKQQMDAMIVVITAQFTTQMAAQTAAYADHFHMLEGYRVVTSEPKVTIEKALQDVGSPTRIIIRSSVGLHKVTTYYFLLSFNKTII